MTLCLIGSQAYNIHCQNSNIPVIREPSDYDYVGTWDDFENLRKAFKPTQCYPIDGGKTIVMKRKELEGNVTIVEIEIAWPDSRAERLMKLINQDFNCEEWNGLVRYGAVFGMDVVIAPLDILYMLKMSHRYLKNSPHFHKTMADIRHMRASFGYEMEVPTYLQEFYKQRMKDTYTYAHPKLNQNKQDFFTDDVPYVYSHDSIHIAIAFPDKPAYTLFSKEGTEVEVDKNKWTEMKHDDKLRTVYEEACVLALERSIIPFDTPPKKAFDMALMKITSSISSGWWREWGWEHFNEVEKMYTEEFVNKFKEGLNNGLVTKHVKGEY